MRNVSWSSRTRKWPNTWHSRRPTYHGGWRACASSNGARWAASGGGGDLDSEVDLPVNSSVQFQISAVIAPLPEEPVFNLASVAVPAQMLDPNLSNNVATDGPDVRGVFRDGFE